MYSLTQWVFAFHSVQHLLLILFLLSLRYAAFGFSGCLLAARWDVSVLFGRIPRPRSWVFAIPFSAATFILMFILLLIGIFNLWVTGQALWPPGGVSALLSDAFLDYDRPSKSDG